MIRHLFVSLMVVMALCSSALTPRSWEGEIPMVGLPLRINIIDDGTVTLDSPKQGVNGIPCVVDYMQGDSMKISIPQLNLEMEGTVDGDSAMNVNFTQGAFSIPMQMTPAVVVAPERSQKLTPPFPYSQTDYSVYNGDVHLAGTLVHPNEAETLVIFVTGSGQQNRDEEIMGHKPFAVIADHLARNGIASYRYDDRGIGQSSGDFGSSTVDDFTEDARCALNSIRSTGIYKKYGIIGHSEGGRIAWALADDVDFVIGLSALAFPGDSILLTQNRIMFEKNGLDPTAYLPLLDSVLHGGSIDPSNPLSDNLMAIQRQMAESPWLVRFINDDPSSDIEKITVPALAIYGTNDTQVEAKSNAARLRILNPQIQIIEFDGLNHLLQPSTTGLPNEYYDCPITIAPQVLSTISSWIQSQQ